MKRKWFCGLLATANAVGGLLLLAGHNGAVASRIALEQDMARMPELQNARDVAVKRASLVALRVAARQRALGMEKEASASAPRKAPIDMGNLWAPDLLADPEYAALLVLDFRGKIESKYGLLFSQLNLPHDQRGAFRKLLIDREMTRMDIGAIAPLHAVGNAGDKRRQELSIQAKAAVVSNNEIRAVIGAENYERYAEYRALGASLDRAEVIAQRLSYGNEPLNATQVFQLAKAIQSGSASEQRVIGGPPGLLPLSETSLVAARQGLSEGQFAGLLQVQKEWRGRVDMGQHQQRVFERNVAGPGVASVAAPSGAPAKEP